MQSKRREDANKATIQTTFLKLLKLFDYLIYLSTQN